MIIHSLRSLSRSSISPSLCRNGKVYPPISDDGYLRFATQLCRTTTRSASPAATPSHETATFPWRHDSVLPERVLEHDDYSGEFNPTTRDPPILRKLVTARELNISGFDVLPIPFYKHEWEVELATNFVVAFEFALEGLLRHTFRGTYIIHVFLPFTLYLQYYLYFIYLIGFDSFSPSEERKRNNLYRLNVT